MEAAIIIRELVPAELAMIVVVLRIDRLPRLMYQRRAVKALVRRQKPLVILLIQPITPA